MYQVIAIERQYASGGNEIGRKLAQTLGYQLYDRNLLTEAAKAMGMAPMYMEGLEETPTGGFLFNLSKTRLGGSSNENMLSMSEKLFLEEKRIIEKAANQGGCVFVGRAAGYILRERNDCLNVFIHSDHEKRIERAIDREGVPILEVESVLKKTDKRRSGFYNSVTKWEWGNPFFFEICLDSGKLGIDFCVKLLAEAAGGIN